MAEKHTKEPWKVSDFDLTTIYPAKEGSSLLFQANRTRRTSHANATRAVACVNALAGYEPDAVREVLEAAKRVVLRREETKDGVDSWVKLGQAIVELGEALARLEEQE